MAMFNFLPQSTNSSKLERWLGKENVEQISDKMRGFHGNVPIGVANIPGRVYATNDGDFVGEIRGGHLASLMEYSLAKLERQFLVNRAFYAGFSSLSDLISEATTAGKRQTLIFGKNGVIGVANCANSLWDVGTIPSTGVQAVSTSGGQSYDNTSSGGMIYTAPTGTDTLHFTTATSVATVANNLLLLHDRIWAVNLNLNIKTPVITAAPSRYQNTTSVNNFVTAFVTTAFTGTPGNFQISYIDQDGIAVTGANQALVASAIARRFPFAASVGNGWFIPLNGGDYGVRSVTSMNQSVTTGSGNMDVVIAKPYVWIPQGIANFPVIIDGINSAFNLVKVADASLGTASCLALMEINKGATTATNYTGTITLVAG